MSFAISSCGVNRIWVVPLRGLGPTRPPPAPRGFAAPVAVTLGLLEAQGKSTIGQFL
jgi:hypothetical protein